MYNSTTFQRQVRESLVPFESNSVKQLAEGTTKTASLFCLSLHDGQFSDSDALDLLLELLSAKQSALGAVRCMNVSCLDDKVTMRLLQAASHSLKALQILPTDEYSCPCYATHRFGKDCPRTIQNCSDFLEHVEITFCPTSISQRDNSHPTFLSVGQSLARMPHLKSLKLSSVRARDDHEFLGAILEGMIEKGDMGREARPLPCLESVAFHYSRGLQIDGLSELINMIRVLPNLRHLEVGDTRRGFCSTRKGQSAGKAGDDTNSVESFFAALLGLHHLHTLEMFSDTLQDSHVASVLASLPHFKSLSRLHLVRHTPTPQPSKFGSGRQRTCEELCKALTEMNAHVGLRELVLEDPSVGGCFPNPKGDIWQALRDNASLVSVEFSCQIPSIGLHYNVSTKSHRHLEFLSKRNKALRSLLPSCDHALWPRLLEQLHCTEANTNNCGSLAVLYWVVKFHIRHWIAQ